MTVQVTLHENGQLERARTDANHRLHLQLKDEIPLETTRLIEFMKRQQEQGPPRRPLLRAPAPTPAPPPEEEEEEEEEEEPEKHGEGASLQAPLAPAVLPPAPAAAPAHGAGALPPLEPPRWD